MKELKKISLKEEIDKEAIQIDKEVRDRKDLDDITVSEKMETSLFNKIQDYEYDRRSKTVHRKKKKRYVVLALAAVLVLVFGSVMTSVGSKSYWKVLWERIAGEEKASIINVDNMDAQETQDIDEIQVYKEIWNELGISTVRMGYMPNSMYLDTFELEGEQRKATLLYKYNGQIIRYTMYMNDEDSSLGQIATDQLFEKYQIETAAGISVKVKVYEVKDSEMKRYVAEFEYMDAQYQIMGIMEKGEFEKIVKNLYFSQ
ncbi:DUF4367 domain-containing protein [[Ruminococcus] torques]|uniref:DUF4367 domain-containing protein n=1 Tax=[Ruminococcus] torques TaxID=33039 RepID=UPI0025A3DE1E|nr:DUF4367 domain-containing protein [[Ruminococcus] torques]MDM8236037.1 DUF4367 domain-containing protein [[Ruminococcus] torques]